MTRSRRTAFALVVAFPLVASVIALGLGPSALSPGDVLDALFGHGDPVAISIVQDLRLPRIATGLLVGAALSLSGVLLQALLRNDLAEPYLVGVGPGAYLGVTVAALAVGAGSLPGPLVRGVFAFLGAAGVSALVFGAARRNDRLGGPTLLLGGLALGAFVSALATALLYVAVPNWDRVVYWLLGHVRPGQAEDLLVVGGAVVFGGVAATYRARDLDAVALGEEGAWLVGVEVRKVMILLGFVACLVAASAVAVAGLIGFVGLLVPHLARALVGSGHRTLVPASMALGAGLLVAADALARIVHPPLEIPVGVVTAALGAPALAWHLFRPRAG